jgi:hypothetical protein
MLLHGVVGGCKVKKERKSLSVSHKARTLSLISPQGVRNVRRAVTEQRIRPPLPSNMSEGLVHLMKECWDEEPIRRPMFSQLCERLTAIAQTEAFVDLNASF